MYDIASIYSARSVDDAIRALQADPAAVVIAGGTDVLIKIREGKLAGCSLVSIHELGEELSGVTLADNGDVEIGPLTTFRGVTFSDVIRRTIPVLGERPTWPAGPSSGPRAPSAATCATALPPPTRPPPWWPWTRCCGCAAPRASGRCPSPSGTRGWARWPWPPMNCW